MAKIREKVLNLAVANAARTSPEFASWLLGHTKFSGADVTPVLARGDWPWYQSKTTGRQSETDILLVFEYRDRPYRFALHIENKQLGDKFRPEQPELYHERARDWMGVAKWGNYQDFEVLLVAPREFHRQNKEKSDIFHRFIAYEDVGKFIPEFAASLA